MAELRTLARPYAKAAFQAADEQKALDAWSAQLATLAALAAEPEAAKLIASPSLTADRKVDAIASVLGDKLEAGSKNFVAILAENQRLALLPAISELFDELKANRERAVDVAITSAFPLDDAMTSALGTSLKTKLDREINVETFVDKSLLGGVLIKAGDAVIDGSVKGRLAKLAEAMNL